MLEKNAQFKREEPLEQLNMYRLIFDSIYNGAIVTDIKGNITHFNKPYGAFLGVDPAAQIGKHCTESVENSRMHIVAKTGTPEINQSHQIKGQNMVVQRIPIQKEGRVIAVFGQVMFKDVQDVRKLASESSTPSTFSCLLTFSLTSESPSPSRISKFDFRISITGW